MSTLIISAHKYIKIIWKNTAERQGKKKHTLLKMHTKKHGIKYSQNKKVRANGGFSESALKLKER